MAIGKEVLEIKAVNDLAGLHVIKPDSLVKILEAVRQLQGKVKNEITDVMLLDGVSVLAGAGPLKADNNEDLASSDTSVMQIVAEMLKKLRDQLSLSISTLQNYDLIEESPTTPGQYYYRADYDGIAEIGSAGDDFTGKLFMMPTFQTIVDQMGADWIRVLYNSVTSGAGLKLRCTPLAMRIETLVDKFDQRRLKLSGVEMRTYVDDCIKDETLVYGSTTFTATPDGRMLETSGGMSKSEFINTSYKSGWLLSLSEFDSSDGELRNYPEKITSNMGLVRHIVDLPFAHKGTYETALIGCMYHLEAARSLPDWGIHLVCGSLLPDLDRIPALGWLEGRFYLASCGVDNSEAVLVVPTSNPDKPAYYLVALNLDFRGTQGESRDK